VSSFARKAGTVYLNYYEFKDEVTQIAQFGTQKPDAKFLSLKNFVALATAVVAIGRSPPTSGTANE